MPTSRALLVVLFAITLAATSALAKDIVQADKDGVRLILGTTSIPEIVGEWVPFSVNFEKAPLSDGDRLTVFADGTRRAYIVTPTGGFLLRQFAARVRMNDGVLRMVVTRTDGAATELTQRIAIDRPYLIPETGQANREFRVRGKGNTIELIHRNRMALTNYASQLDIAVSAGKLSISMTPYSSGLAHYRIEADHSLEGGTIEMQLAEKPYDSTK